jgi:hypothetical protein
VAPATVRASKKKRSRRSLGATVSRSRLCGGGSKIQGLFVAPSILND